MLHPALSPILSFHMPTGKNLRSKSQSHLLRRKDKDSHPITEIHYSWLNPKKPAHTEQLHPHKFPSVYSYQDTVAHSSPFIPISIHRLIVGFKPALQKTFSLCPSPSPGTCYPSCSSLSHQRGKSILRPSPMNVTRNEEMRNISQPLLS
ncbi:hypothetical protein AVEN_192271-1 [Araneus ventricosus]|uniref:Uncharacterized protein n=1 Tax=Araneus ventricosus TaxID=182803 RepID=A0A4Y2NQD3_ARAVE|nr:hypothetical protein AVEN_192271-1 [Araneus ventricosus]